MSQNSRIFKATYSGVPVYEMLCKGVAVMRRRSDAYLNATQILKVADFDKPQRTRILEREVQIGKHEKVQGGYGKYQGTWVPFERGVALAQQYQVDQLLQPIFDYVKGDESPPVAPKHVTAASTRPRRAREPRRKRVKHEEEIEVSEAENSSQYSEIHESDTSMLIDGGAAAAAAGGSRTPSPLFRSTSDVADGHLLPPPMTYHHHHQQNHRPSKRAKRTNNSARDQDDEETEDEEPGHKASSSYAQKLLHNFISGSTEVPPILQHPPRDLDVNVIIDDEGHTSLHWAAAMGQLQTVKVLIHLKADVYRVNFKGQTALMRSVLFTNNFDRKTFHHMLDMLQKTIFNIDKKDQTVFHHVASTASWKGKVHASRYYMECLIDKLGSNRSELISILNVQDVYGDTALTIAARIGNKKLVRLLIDAGASTEIANEEGMTAQDYLTEFERSGRFSQDVLGVGGGGGVGAVGPGGVAGAAGGVAGLSASASSTLAISASEQAARARLRQKIETMFKQILANDRSVPTASQLFDGFAGSYERDLTQKEQALKEKRVDLELTRKRLAETRRILDQIRLNPGLLDEAEGAAKELETRLRKLMHYAQKEKLSQLIEKNDDEQLRQQQERLPQQSSDNVNDDKNVKKEGKEEQQQQQQQDGDVKKDKVSEDALAKSTQELEEKLSSLQKNRRKLVDEIIQLKTQTPGKRYQEYKRLISMCCNVAYENVDMMLSPLLASFNESG
ncbi:hypothetical protein BDB00DRAFT_935535 [Zychaea mexicana]|uniref:uncharacterized protein n=1 Tax=Zychaea mexicana TaxID=64656 RepID=UPI0022FDCF22|nr:uncharacterized protein BDB00DRAFT_935535 [Zychaea mexicana]KAI9498309.1 hypothetical protein BDB00DRAFT_935535 [Zychaea mexicana]